MRGVATFALVAALAACRGGVDQAAPSYNKEGAAAAARRPTSPRSRRELPTTDGALAIENLQAQIAGDEKLAARSPQAAKALVGLYATRAQFLGQLADYDRSCALADELSRGRPDDAEVYPLRAACRASLHRFGEASADLDQAARRGARPDELAAARAGIDQALGHYDAALAARQKKADDWPTLASLGALASLYSERGEVDRAEALFLAAQEKFGDVSPLPLAWLYFQQGLMWQKAGSPARARELFEAAHERLPAYAPATSHLAAVLALTGERARAIEILRALTAAPGCDDPEYAAQLASLIGAGADRDALVARARARYDELIARHPAAFADHAARFWLGVGGDAARALKLARLNLQNRATGDAYQLLFDAAAAAGAGDAAICDAAARAAALPIVSASLRFSVDRTRARCGHAQAPSASAHAAD